MGLIRTQIGDLCFYHAERCSRYKSGFCSTRRCLQRGGWSPGIEVDYSVATCEEHETIELLERLRDVEDALTRENIATMSARPTGAEDDQSQAHDEGMEESRPRALRD